eukprot:6625245-Ditylum_brightwellii.AAC.1
MRLLCFPPSRVDTAVHQLPEPGMVVDSRPNSNYEKYFKLEVTANGTTMRIIRISQTNNP